MIDTKFQASKPSDSEEDDFRICFYDLNLGPDGTGPSCLLGPSFHYTW